VLEGFDLASLFGIGKRKGADAENPRCLFSQVIPDFINAISRRVRSFALTPVRQLFSQLISPVLQNFKKVHLFFFSIP